LLAYESQDYCTFENNRIPKQGMRTSPFKLLQEEYGFDNKLWKKVSIPWTKPKNSIQQVTVMNKII
jgi:hypothetical protein